MRALRVVGLTEDGEVVLEDPVRLERFRVPADERLRAAARGDLSRLGQIAIELESQLRPREIQARIRAGASVEQVAAAAGVPEQKIERFAYPVLLERFRGAENAQRAHPVRADGPDNRTLAEVVEHTFGLRGQAYEGARWDSWKGEDGRWVVALGWRAGRSDNRAHWTFQPGAHGGTVTALDEHASDLVEGLPARPLRTVGAVVDMHPEEDEQPPSPSQSQQPTPVEQWRAAASDSYRERMPLAPETTRPAGDRGPGRSAPEPRRPLPPAPRQAEVSRPADTEARPATPSVPAARTEQIPSDQSRPRSAPDGGPPTVDARPGPAATGLSTDPSADLSRDAGSAPREAGAVAATRSGVENRPAGGETPPAATAPASSSAAPPDVPVTPAPAGPDAAGITDTSGDTSGDTTGDTGPAAEGPTPEPSGETLAVPPGDAPAAGRRTKKGKPVMPSWDEVLLGVRGPR